MTLAVSIQLSFGVRSEIPRGAMRASVSRPLTVNCGPAAMAVDAVPTAMMKADAKRMLEENKLLILTV